MQRNMICSTDNQQNYRAHVACSSLITVMIEWVIIVNGYCYYIWGENALLLWVKNQYPCQEEIIQNNNYKRNEEQKKE